MTPESVGKGGVADLLERLARDMRLRAGPGYQSAHPSLTAASAALGAVAGLLAEGQGGDGLNDTQAQVLLRGQCQQIMATLKQTPQKDLLDCGGNHKVVQARYGAIIINRHDVFLGRSLELYGESSQAELDLLAQLLAPGDVVVDVGANFGTHTLAFASMVGPSGRVLSFEPQRIVHQALCGSIALNGLGNVEAYQAGVSAAPGWLRMPDLRYDIPNNYGGLKLQEHQAGQKVPVVSLDDFLELGRLALIKIDVEGMERQVLEGAAQTLERFAPALYVENDEPAGSEGLVKQIARLGYRLYWHRAPAFNPANFAGNPENVWGEADTVNLLCLPAGKAGMVEGLAEVTDPTWHPKRRR